MKKKIHLLVFALLAVLLMGSITVQASGFELSHKKVTVNIGESADIDITGTEKTPKWTSWNINKVRVDEDGVVTGVRTGKTTVSARIGLTFKKCTVTVVDPSIKLNKKTATIFSGGHKCKDSTTESDQ